LTELVKLKYMCIDISMAIVYEKLYSRDILCKLGFNIL